MDIFPNGILLLAKKSPKPSTSVGTSANRSTRVSSKNLSYYILNIHISIKDRKRCISFLSVKHFKFPALSPTLNSSSESIIHDEAATHTHIPASPFSALPFVRCKVQYVVSGPWYMLRDTCTGLF